LKLGLATGNKHKKVFSILIIMVKAHNKSRRDLLLMNVTMLKDMVRKHNLDNAIKRYSSMRKADLVDALMKHSTKPNLVIVEEKKETPAERAARRAKPRVIKSKPIAKSAPLKKSELVPNTSPSKAIQEFEESKKAARQKAAKKPAAPKKKAAAKKPAAAKPKFTAKELKLLAQGRRHGSFKVVDAIETGIFTEGSEKQSEGTFAALQQLYAKALRRAEAPANAVAIDKASLKELLGDMLKLKETLLAQKPRITALRKKANEANLKDDPTGKVKPGGKKGESYRKVVNNQRLAGGFSTSYHPDESRMQDFIDKEADKLDKFIRMGSSISAAKTSGARQPTLKELGLESTDQYQEYTEVPEIGWMGMTKLVVADFIKARSKAINAAVKGGK